jgi:hypothetical protein
MKGEGMAKVYVVFDYDDYEGSMGPHSVWSTEELAKIEIETLKVDYLYTKFRYKGFEVD